MPFFNALEAVATFYTVPFEVFAEPFYSDSNISYLENVMQDVREGKANFAEHELIESKQAQGTLLQKDRPI